MMLAAMRVCVIYDCLFPYTVGGAERWYRNLAERLAAEGHEVTYLTLRQWERGGADRPRRARAGRERGPAHGALHAGRAPAHRCRRSCSGWGCFLHLLRHGRALRGGAHVLVPLLLAAGGGARAPARRASSWSSTGSRSGAAPTGSTTSAVRAGASGRSCSACARSCPSAPSASQSSTRGDCARRACAAR